METRRRRRGPSEEGLVLMIKPQFDWVARNKVIKKGVSLLDYSQIGSPTIAVLTPDRNDRPEFLEQCIKYVARQTAQPAKHLIFNNIPLSGKIDIGHRVRSGIYHLRSCCDYVAIVENDDWYDSRYLKLMSSRLDSFAKRRGYPLIFGVDNTTFYHLVRKEHFFYKHVPRSSLCSMLIRSDVLDWCSWPDDECFVDLFLYNSKQLGCTPLCSGKRWMIGFKHGLGLCGSGRHGRHRKDNWVPDPNREWLSKMVGGDFEFYERMIHKLSKDKCVRML